MSPTPDGVVEDRLAAGWRSLDRGDWQDARDVFEAVVAHEETPEALEGLSWAAWWLDDASTVFGARERAYLLYRNRGKRAHAARMATWLAADELDFHGAVAVARGWLRRARRLLESVEAGPDHGWLAFHEGYLAMISGDTARTAELGREASAAGRRFDVPDLEMLGLALQGTSLVARARVEEGMAYLDEATTTALTGEATIPISSAWACCFLVGSCTAVLDFERAFEWCDRIAEFADRYGSRYMLAFCRAEYGQVHLWRGQWRDAEEMLEASIDDFSTSRPAMVGAPMVSLAELRRRQARIEEALSLLDRAGASGPVQVCRARIALDQGDALRAAELLERRLRQLGPERRLDRIPALEVLVRARLALGELDEAEAALDSLCGIGQSVATDPLQASTDLLEGSIAAAAGDHERARVLFEDAVDLFNRIGAPYEAAVARVELAECLAELGRPESARSEAQAAHECLVELGAEVDARRATDVLQRSSSAGENRAPTEVTARESEVLELLAEGLTNKQIAGRLVVSEHTVHRHVTNILRKLGLTSRTAAASYAIRSGMLDSDRG